MNAKGFDLEGRWQLDRTKRLFGFMDEAIPYFLTKVGKTSRDLYFADRDIRSILDKTTNDLILCLVDIAEECLKKKGRPIPDTYKDTLLACHEFFGDLALKIAPLTKHRNEMVHQYLKINWQNIITVKSKVPEIKLFTEKARELISTP